jgi:hypothetical protein
MTEELSHLPDDRGVARKSEKGAFACMADGLMGIQSRMGLHLLVAMCSTG